jgi:H+/Cl- antiporter ClcA
MFIAVAAAAGLGAAFRAPLGAVVFVFEELASHTTIEMINR